MTRKQSPELYYTVLDFRHVYMCVHVYVRVCVCVCECACACACVCVHCRQHSRVQSY